MISQLTPELRRMFETGSVGMVITTREGIVLDANGALGDLLGYSAEELQGQPFAVHVCAAPNDTTHRSTFARVGASNVAIRRERRLRRKDGTLLNAQVTSSMLRDADGNPSALVQAVVDLSAHAENVQRLTAELAARERSEGEAREAHDFLVAALMSMPVGVLVVDRPTGKPILSNSRYAPEAIVREDGAPYPAAELPLARTLADGAPHSITDAWLVNAEGARVALTHHAAPISFKGRDAAVLVVQDVTALRDEERQRHAAEARYRDLFEQVNDGILVVTREAGTTIVDANPAGLELYGYRREELAGLELAALSPVSQPDGRPSAAVMAEQIAALEREAVVRFPWRGSRKMGGPIDLEMTLKRLQLEDSPELLILQVRDVTRQRVLEDDLRQAQKQEAVGVLAGGLAHDYNNLLTGVMGFIDLALQALDRPGELDGARLKKFLAQAQRGANRSADLTRQLLTFSRKSGGAMSVIDLNDCVEKALAMIRSLLGESIAVELALAAEDLPLRGDASQLEQVLLNLAINARDAMPRGGKLRVETRRSCGNAVLVVEDDGAGMSDDVKARIFEPYFTTKGHGTGLGLAVARTVVQRHGGTIEVESAPSRGCRFTVSIPCAAEAPAPGTADDAVASIPTGDARLLVVDDDPLVREATASMLEALGYRVSQADGAAQALERIAAERFDLVISDVVMPGISGVELEQRIRREHPGLKVLLVSGYAEEAFARHGLDESSVEALLKKPLTLATLGKKVHELLAR